MPRTHRRGYLKAVVGGGISSLAGCVDSVGESSGNTATIHVPQRTLVDTRLDISVTDVPSETAVWVEAHTEDGAGKRWFSRSLFEPTNGRIDLQSADPIQGTYRESDGMGLFWSLQPDDLKTRSYDTNQQTQSVQLRVRPETPDATPLAETTVTRPLVHPSSKETDIEKPIVGTLVEAPNDGPAPGVILFHGSAGNRPIAPARALASHGFTVLALQYVSSEHDSLPDNLVEVPIEYADQAVRWLAEQAVTTDDPICLGGFSRGGELALLMGSRHENIGAVVNWVGSGLLFNAVVLTDDSTVSPDTPDTSAWSLDGEPLAHPSGEDFEPRADVLDAYQTWLEEETTDETLERAEIPLSEIEAPILLLSAGSDGVWPSRYLLTRTERRLEALDYGYRFEHHSYDGAGHGISVPYLPSWKNRPGGPFGGTIAGTAAAEADSWPRVIEFFNVGSNKRNQ
ncbi:MULTISPECIES: acyl-CoA thioester hydrolase/BAAT C-terminal domain-containing protein [Haloferax]|uniref:Uncharacterized protein n=2 Tax=Haloferax TaxID=2251 RepID=A0A6G1Z4T1_9EURY|nr:MULTISPECIES: acyl-CoA thioester hydrolase/BAAT C-terminal domain-containing protein [Haloferax]KAB1188852.1 hypothetical protein Hfx1149_12725 [Haloferax sp. CBA1149]MRW81569.1 hypothetical protein [Haloferax marinisediminis]